MATAIPKACLASSAIRCRDVETGPTLGVLAVFPSTGATCRCLWLLNSQLLGILPAFRASRDARDLAHAAFADEGGDVIVAESGTDSKRHELFLNG